MVTTRAAADPPAPSAPGERPQRPADIRVLHVYRYFHPDFTGDGIYFQKLIPLLLAHSERHDVLAVSTAAPSAPEHRWRIDGATVDYLHRSGEGRGIPWWRLQAYMLRHARRYTAIHLHAHVDRYFMAYLLAKLAGCKLLFSCTLDDSPRQLLETYRPLFRPLVRRLYRLIDRFVVISPKLRDDSLDIVAPGHIHLVPQGAAVPSVSSPAERQRHRARLGLREGDVALLYVGSLIARKNVRFLIESMPAIKAADGRVKLFVVGPDLEPDYGAAVRRLAAETGLSDSVHFTNRTEDPDPYYRAADMVVFGSLSEGFGNVLLEGMAYGLPVVARRLPGVTDFFIADGSNGFLFDTAEAYRTAVLRLAAEPELRRRIGDNARRSVERDFTLDAIARRYVSLYGA